jgi:hypothetical protein
MGNFFETGPTRIFILWKEKPGRMGLSARVAQEHGAACWMAERMRHSLNGLE